MGLLGGVVKFNTEYFLFSNLKSVFELLLSSTTELTAFFSAERWFPGYCGLWKLGVVLAVPRS